MGEGHSHSHPHDAPSASRTAPALWCLASAALFGASTPAAKALLGEVQPLQLAGLLYLGAALATLPFSFKGGSWKLATQRKNALRLLGAVVLGGVAGPILLLLGLKQAPAASVALWLNLETAATALLGWLVFREHLDRRTTVAVLLTIAAGVILASPSGFELAPAALLVALACVCWALDNNLTALIDGCTPAQTTCVKGFGAGVTSLGLAAGFEGLSMAPSAVGFALGVGALGYGLSLVLYVSGAQRLGATRSQILFSTAPFLGMGVAWLALREPVLLPQLLAVGLLVPSLYLLMTASHDHEHAHHPQSHTHLHRHDDGHHDHTHEGLDPSVEHTHEHDHGAHTHTHPHEPDLHHRHDHEEAA